MAASLGKIPTTFVRRLISPLRRSIGLPNADTEAMQLHLNEISRHVAKGAVAVLLMDRAGWHTTSKLEMPANIKPIFLPSPQATYQQFYEYLTGAANDKPLWQHFAASMLRVFAAFFLACIFAIPLGIAMGMSRVWKGIFRK